MPDARLRSSAIVAVTALLALVVLAVAAPSARADHDDPAALCRKEFKRDFDYYWSLPIKSRRNGALLGRVAISVESINSSLRRVCAVTLRRYHAHRRFTSIKIKRQNETRWRKDASYVYREYAGPVVRINPRGECAQFVGRIDGGVPVDSAYCW